jgi:thiamine biosynthesis lipoprotein
MRRAEAVMGTNISVVVADPAPTDVVDSVFDWFRAVDERFSTYKPDSEVCTLSPALSPLMREVLDRCGELWKETAGYFDVYATGRLDPSGYVKGWSVQVASDQLLAAGCANHLINAGGDVRVRGEAARGRPWRVGIRHPFSPADVCCVVAGTDLAVATSGIYERGPHVVDPYTGVPATGLRSVTVVSSGPLADLGTADAYATAALAMGGSGLDWLAALAGYDCAVVTDDAILHMSDTLPLAP